MLGKNFDKKIVLAMARGTIVLDENLFHLEDLLRDINVRVVKPRASMTDARIIQELLSNRILITNNSKDFISKAAAYDYGIIATEFLSSKDPEGIVQKIHEALIDLELWSRRHGFIVKLKDSGPPDFKALLG